MVLCILRDSLPELKDALGIVHDLGSVGFKGVFDPGMKTVDGLTKGEKRLNMVSMWGSVILNACFKFDSLLLKVVFEDSMVFHTLVEVGLIRLQLVAVFNKLSTLFFQCNGLLIELSSPVVKLGFPLILSNSPSNEFCMKYVRLCVQRINHNAKAGVIDRSRRSRH